MPLRSQRTIATFGAIKVREFVASVDLHSAPLPGDSELVGLHMVESGSIDVASAGGARRFAPGDAFLVRHEILPPTAVGANLELFSVLVPAEGLATAAPAPSEVRPVRPDSALLKATLAFARQATTSPDALGNFETYYLERLLIEMVIGVSVEGGEARPRARTRDHFADAFAVIEARLSDFELSPRVVARDVRISLRQLERAFAARSTTVGRQIRRKRVEYAAGLLTDRAYDVMTVSAIAEHSGFSNDSSLARAFAQEGFASPGRVRRVAQEAGRSHTELDEMRTEDDVSHVDTERHLHRSTH